MATVHDLRVAAPVAAPVAAATRAAALMRRVAVVTGVLSLVSLPLFYGLGAWPLMDPDEGRNAEIAREMLTSGAYLVPHFNGLPFLDKPVGLFWMIAASFRLVGVGELGARLPSAVSAVGLVLVTFAIARRLLGTRHGLMTAAVLATVPLVMIFGRLTIFDMPFTALVTLAVWALVEGRLSGGGRLWSLLAGLAMGCATLTKGPVGVAVPMLGWLAARGSLPQPGAPGRRVPPLLASLALLAVVVPWVAVVAVREPGFLHYAVIDETLLRFTAPERFNRAGPAYYPTLVLFAGFGIWTVVLGALAPALLRRARDGSPRAHAIHFAVRMVVAILVLFTVSASKRPGYVLPAFAPLAMLTAIGVLDEPRRAAAAVRGAAVIGVAIGVTLILCALGAGAALGRSLGEASPAITPAVLSAAGATLLTWGVLTAASGRGRPLIVVALGAALIPALCAALLGPLGAYAEGRSGRAIVRQVDPQAEVIAFRSFRTSLPFYLGRPVLLVSKTGRELTSNYVLAQYELLRDGPFLGRPRDLWARLAGPAPVQVFSSPAWEATLRRHSRRPLVRVAEDRHHVLLATR